MPRTERREQTVTRPLRRDVAYQFSTTALCSVGATNFEGRPDTLLWGYFDLRIENIPLFVNHKVTADDAHIRFAAHFLLAPRSVDFGYRVVFV